MTGHEHSLGEAINLFKCCVFTLKIFTVVLPAFLIAGAIEVLVPSHTVMKYLGAKAHPLVSYGASAFSGNFLSVCSCNVVPIFQGILKRGAGIGPAFCFVFAAPAIHIVNTIMTYQIIAPQFAIARFIAVPIIAILTGVTMYLLFRKEENARHAEMEMKQGQIALVSAGPHRGHKAEVFLGLLMVVLVFGAWSTFANFLAAKLPISAGVGLYLHILAVLLLIGGLTLLARKWFSREEATEWWRQSGHLAWKILLIFIPAVVVIGLIVQYIPMTWITPIGVAHQNDLAFGHPQGNRLLPTFLAALFGTLMYFPMLTEIAFTKGLIIQNVAVGPALALLLGGPGLSLPGLLLIARIAGWKKTLAYWLVTLVLITLVAYGFGSRWGDYLCPCNLEKQKYQSSSAQLTRVAKAPSVPASLAGL